MIESDFYYKNGYTVPKDWDVITLGDLGEPFMCKRILKEQTSDDGDIPFYKIGTFGKTADAFITRSLFNEYKTKYNYPQKGDILISASGTIGRHITFDGKEAYFQDSNIVWINNDESMVSNAFLSKWLDIINWATTDGGTITRLYNNNLKKSVIVKPTSDEQQSIATALSDIDALISTLQNLIEKKRNIKQGAMQELLSGKRRLKGFGDSWISKSIGKIGYTYNGLSGKTKEDFGHGEGQYITFLNILKNPIIKEDIFEKVNILPGESQNKALKGDLFFNTSSETPEEVGFCATLESEIDDLYINSFCFGFRLTDPEVSNVFLAYFFRSSESRELMGKLANGVTRFNLSKKKMKAASIKVPSTRVEQEAIARVLRDMDLEIEALEYRLVKYQSIKQGMMQQLLTGKIRLI